MINGVINIYKEAGYTSHDVVAKMRGILKQKKIGHTGTLDPDAVGVLPVCLGNATKLCDLLTDKSKTYEALLRLGIETDTQDTSGEVLRTAPVSCGEELVRSTIESFVGEYDQIPPMYSALKVDGKKLYELAREGKTVERKARRVTIYEITIEKIELPDITIKVHCSKGTYIRTLCHDIGQKLGCGGVMAYLKRTQVDRFLVEDAITLSELEQIRDAGGIEEIIIPVEKLFDQYESVFVEEKWKKLVLNGNSVYANQISPVKKWENLQRVCVFDGEKHFYGIYEFHKEEKRFRPIKMFL